MGDIESNGGATYTELISGCISAERFARYQTQEAEPETLGLARYLHNICLCESLYPALALFEDSLRNCLDREVTRAYGAEWFDKIGLLRSEEREK